MESERYYCEIVGNANKIFEGSLKSFGLCDSSFLVKENNEADTLKMSNNVNINSDNDNNSNDNNSNDNNSNDNNSNDNNSNDNNSNDNNSNDNNSNDNNSNNNKNNNSNNDITDKNNESTNKNEKINSNNDGNITNNNKMNFDTSKYGLPARSFQGMEKIIFNESSLGGSHSMRSSGLGERSYDTKKERGKEEKSSRSNAEEEKSSRSNAKEEKSSRSNAKEAKSSRSNAEEEKSSRSNAEEEKSSRSNAEEEKSSRSNAKEEKSSRSNAEEEKSSRSNAKEEKSYGGYANILNYFFFCSMSVLKKVYMFLPLVLLIIIYCFPYVHRGIPDEWMVKHLFTKFVLPAYDYEYYSTMSSRKIRFPVFSNGDSSSHAYGGITLQNASYEHDTYDDKLLDDEMKGGSEGIQKAMYKKIIEAVKKGKVPSPLSLNKHSKEFTREIVRVTDNVYIAVGYGLANSVVIVGENLQCVVIDTLESPQNMAKLWRDFVKVAKAENAAKTNFPANSEYLVKAIIYTHFHTDHILGASAVFRHNFTQVYAHVKTQLEIDKVFTLVGPITYIRSMRQFGTLLDRKNFVNAGIGKYLDFNSTKEFDSVYPTNLMYSNRMNLTIAGIDLELIHAPGESSDQIVVWYRNKEILMGADNIYKSFPNIYAIRGTEMRDCISWINSLDVMRQLKPKYLLLGHTKPIFGQDNIQQIILSYRDAIQFVHDQTVRYMNKGYAVNDIVKRVKLPQNLKRHPYLQEHYGRIEWAVRSIFDRYLGWFSGYAEDLNPLTFAQKSFALADLAGNVDKLIEKAEQNFEEGNFQWAIELSSAAYNINKSKKAKQIKILSLKAMGALERSANGRNWYLSEAYELENDFVIRIEKEEKKEILRKFSIDQVFKLLPIRVDSSAPFVKNVVEFHFEDTKEKKCVHYRNGIAHISWPCETEPNNKIYTTKNIWLAILNEKLSPAIAYFSGKLRVQGSILNLFNVFSLTDFKA